MGDDNCLLYWVFTKKKIFFNDSKEKRKTTSLSSSYLAYLTKLLFSLFNQAQFANKPRIPHSSHLQYCFISLQSRLNFMKVSPSICSTDLVAQENQGMICMGTRNYLGRKNSSRCIIFKPDWWRVLKFLAIILDSVKELKPVMLQIKDSSVFPATTTRKIVGKIDRIRS